MEFKITSKQVLNILYIIAWIIFLGLCIETGSFVFNAFYTKFISENNTGYFGLTNLFTYDAGYFYVLLFLMTITGGLKTLLFYQIVKILHEKKLQMVQPFNNEMGRFIFNISYLSVGIGLFCFCGVNFTEWFIKQGVQMPDVRQLSFGGADVWLFMGVTLFVIAYMFKRGIEIQSENELTI